MAEDFVMQYNQAIDDSRIDKGDFTREFRMKPKHNVVTS